jgi:hypothetical protein
MPDYTLFDHNDLGTELVGILRGTTGRRFSDLSEAQRTSGWSMVVWDLIQVSMGKVFRRKRSGLVDRSRVVHSADLDGMFFVRRSAFAGMKTLGRITTDRSQVAEIFGLAKELTHSIDPTLDRLQDMVAGASRSRASIDFPPGSAKGRDSDEGETGISLILIETSEGDFATQ